MSRQRALIYSFSVLVTLLLVSCSPPAGDLESKKSVPAASTPPPANSPSVVSAAPAEASKPVDAPKKQLAEAAKPAKAPSNRHITIPPEVAAPAPAPAPAPQQTASNEPTSAAIALPAPQTQITPPTAPPPPPLQPTTKHFTLPAGTEVYIRTIDAIDTESSHPNQTFRASLDKDIVADNQTVFPRRSDVFLKVIEVQSAGKLKGQSELKVQLDRLFMGKDSYTVTSNTFEQTGASEGKKAARNVGIGAAAGAVLGGILGGGKGAVIGAGSGGGGGAVLSKGEQVKIASETQLMFKLENPLDVTVTIPPAGTAVAASGGPAKLVPPDRDRSASQSSSSSFDDLSGNWTVTTSGQQYMTLQLSLRQNGNNLQGSITDPQGYGTIPVRGSVNGNYVNFYTQSQYGTNSMQMQFTGALQSGSDRMQGNVTMPAYNNNNGGGFPGGGGYPRRGGQGRTQTTQARWTAQRN